MADGLVDGWNKSRQERTHMTPGERVHSIEGALKGRMPTHRHLDWLLPARIPRERDDQDRERE